MEDQIIELANKCDNCVAELRKCADTLERTGRVRIRIIQDEDYDWMKHIEQVLDSDSPSDT